MKLIDKLLYVCYNLVTLKCIVKLVQMYKCVKENIIMKYKVLIILILSVFLIIGYNIFKDKPGFYLNFVQNYYSDYENKVIDPKYEVRYDICKNSSSDNIGVVYVIENDEITNIELTYLEGNSKSPSKTLNVDIEKVQALLINNEDLTKLNQSDFEVLNLENFNKCIEKNKIDEYKINYKDPSINVDGRKLSGE